MKLALGTVQFGLDYGAFGDSSKPSLDAVSATLARANETGIDMLDTAAAYGESEAVLGALDVAQRFAIVTKIPSLNGTVNARADVAGHISQSLKHLKCTSVHGVMAHSAIDLLGPDGRDIWGAMEAAQSAGQITRIGVSVYSPEQADAIMERYPIGIIQLPFNIFDQRALQSGLFNRLSAAGIEIHIRSVFLQGLLLSSPGSLPKHLTMAAHLLASFHTLCHDIRCGPLAAALAFVKSQIEIDRIVVGVRGTEELNGILSAWNEQTNLPNMSGYASNDISIIDPSQWQVK